MRQSTCCSADGEVVVAVAAEQVDDVVAGQAAAVAEQAAAVVSGEVAAVRQADVADTPVVTEGAVV